MIRDQGPNNSLGFGVTRGQVPDAGEREGSDPESGFIARALHDHPLAKFFAVSTATVVAAGVSGAVVRGLGKKGLSHMALQAAQSNDNRYKNVLKGFRDVRGILDEYEGVARHRGQKLVDIKGSGRTAIDDPSLDTTVTKSGFFFTQGEKERMKALGMDPPAEWTIRDEIQQRLVRQARRLPYELPAAYITQRAVTDRLLGVNDERDQVNWANPFDIIGDFAKQSLKNTATALVPFEVGGAAARQGWRKAMTQTGSGGSTAAGGLIKDLMVNIESSLGLIGQETGDLLYKATRYSQQTAGATSTAFQQAAGRTKPITETLHALSKGRSITTKDIPLFGDVVRLNNTFRDRWRTLGDEFDHSEAFLAGKTVTKHGAPVQMNKVASRLGSSKFYHLSASLTNLAGGKGELASGQFMEEMAQNEYRKIVHARALKAGLDDETAQRVKSSFSFTLPQSVNDPTHIANRLGFGNDDIFEGTGPWRDALAKKVKGLPGAQKFQDRTFVETLISGSDREFMRNRGAMTKTHTRQFEHMMDRLIAPEARNALGYKRAAYGEFSGSMSGDAGEFLVRRTAQRLKVATETMGVRRSTSELHSDIISHGLDPTNKHQLRAFLVDQGDISKPWNPKGLNILGLQSLSVQEAMDRRIIADDDPVKAQADKLAAAIKGSDWDSGVLNRLKVGGIYKTANDQVVDFNPILRAGRKFADRMNTELQIPFIHIKPLQLFGYNIRSDIANSQDIQFQAGYRSQPFAGKAADNAEGYLWFKGRKARGRLATIGLDESGRPGGDWLQGQFRPMETGANTLAGRNVRLAAGKEQGRLPNKPRSTFGRIFNIDENQPDSLIETWKRFRNRRTDTNYLATAARRGMAEDFSRDPKTAAEIVTTLNTGLRNQTMARNVLENIAPGAPLARMTQHTDAARNEFLDVASSDSSTLLRFAKRFGIESPADAGITDDAAAGMLTRAERNVLKTYQSIHDPSVLDAVMPQNLSRLGIHRREDELRLKLMRYMSVREGLQGSSDFNQFIASGHAQLRAMQKAGLISRQEMAQGRAVLGSFQLGFISMEKYSYSATRQSLHFEILEAIQKNEGGQFDDLREVLEDTAQNQSMPGTPMRRFLGRGIKNKFGFGDQKFDGTEFNPFSYGQQSVYVPTFSTAFARNPSKAVASVFGFGTWNDPSAFSGAGIASSHIMNRMNRPLAGFGLGLDPSKYNGPAHMLAQGFILQRAAPIFAAGATFSAADRTLGAYSQPKDEQGNRVYSPLLLGTAAEGLVAAQSAVAGVMPGGQTYADKNREIREGEVAVRKGRWWPLGNTPWKGGKVQYYRPSWYRRMKSGYQYTDQGWDTPMEKLAFGYDMSPLRPLDPYRYERQHYYDRPYPVTGEYFTGPWGPMTGVLNQTVGRVLKPRKMMHEEEVNYNLARYQPVGAYGMAAPATGRPIPNEPTIAGAIGMGGSSGGTGAGGSAQNSMYQSAASGPNPYASGSSAARSQVFGNNQKYLDAAGGSGPVRGVSTAPLTYPYTQDAFKYNPYDLANPRRPANPMKATAPVNPGSFGYQASEFGYLMQEWAGIYGFGFGSVRAGLGLGNQDMLTDRPVLASPGAAYGTARSFWDLNLGGLGDFPTPLEGDYANLEISEITRRFIPKPRKPNEVNPIENNMGKMYPWLPGNNYFKNFKWGDPYTTVNEGEMRLPGAGYERLHQLHSDETGRYGRLDRFRILADVAPYSEEFRAAAAELRKSGLDSNSQQIFDTTMQHVEDMKRNNDFTSYKYRYSSPEEQGMSDLEFGFRALGENVSHMNTYANTKFMPRRTAVEDWERDNVYGASFAQWQHPISDFLMPAVYRATTRNPISAAFGLGVIGRLFGATPQAKAVGSLVGGVVGFSAGLVRGGSETVSGERFIPASRRREMALEEYADILQYTKSSRAYQQAKAAGNEGVAAQFKKQMQSTMYGADIYEGTPGELEAAIPKRKREHFRAMLQAPPQERERIVSTAGRLERRIYQAAWGMKVEKRPELAEYFGEHELPDEGWEGWDPRTSMDLVKIKMGQAQGLNMSQMGYYPQQLKEANLINPSYPDYRGRSSTRSARSRLEKLLTARGMSGSVREIDTPYAGTKAQVSYGVY